MDKMCDTSPLTSSENPTVTAKDLKIVLLGRTGSGKSAAGNTILGTDAFEVSCCDESETKEYEVSDAQFEGRNISVTDTPGVCDTTMSEEELKEEINKCVFMSAPGPHVFLLVIRLGERFTDEIKNAVKWIQENFGEKSKQYTMILFTHADQIDLPIEQYLEKSRHWKKLVNECQGRYHCFNNKDNNPSQVRELLDKIDRLVESNEEKHYTNDMYQEAQRKLTESDRVKEQMIQLIENNRECKGWCYKLLEIGDLIFQTFSLKNTMIALGILTTGVVVIYITHNGTMKRIISCSLKLLSCLIKNTAPLIILKFILFFLKGWGFNFAPSMQLSYK